MSFYEVPYYTHSRRAAGKATASVVERVFRHLAWRADRSIEVDDAWIRACIGPSDRVVDLGCGDGALLGRLRARAGRAVGVEPDPLAAGRARQSGLKIHDGTAEDLPRGVLEASGFSWVFMTHALEHCLDVERALGNARDLLEDGGRIVIEVPNNEWFGLATVGRHWQWLDVPRHLNFFTTRSLQAFVERANFTVERVEYRGFARQFSPQFLETANQIAGAFGDRAAAVGYRSLMLRGSLMPARKKYDSVRVVAAKLARPSAAEGK